MGIDINRFRFRVWDSIENMFISNPWWVNRDDGGLFLKCENHQILEQCTGLKDKNGKLIYEGDIISFNEIKECGTVVWDKNNLLWRYCGKNEKHYVQPLGDLDMDYWQVVGNIHENIELLRGAQCQ